MFYFNWICRIKRNYFKGFNLPRICIIIATTQVQWVEQSTTAAVLMVRKQLLTPIFLICYHVLRLEKLICICFCINILYLIHTHFNLSFFFHYLANNTFISVFYLPSHCTVYRMKYLLNCLPKKADNFVRAFWSSEAECSKFNCFTQNHYQNCV